MGEHVSLVEVGPRDGLQNEKQIIATGEKIALVDALTDCGFKRIEVTSFVSAKWVPQLSDAADVMAGITRKPDVTYSVLTPNLKGLDMALQSTPGEVAVFTSASEGFCEKISTAQFSKALNGSSPLSMRQKKPDFRCVVMFPALPIVPMTDPLIPIRSRGFPMLCTRWDAMKSAWATQLVPVRQSALGRCSTQSLKSFLLISWLATITTRTVRRSRT